MRPIDADALIKQINNPYTEYPIMIQIRRAIKEFINSAPTIEPKCGEWLIEKTLYDNYNYRCSCCNWYECHAYPDVEPYNFCPNCGTDMRNKDDE